jgi:hypothetical protein
LPKKATSPPLWKTKSWMKGCRYQLGAGGVYWNSVSGSWKSIAELPMPGRAHGISNVHPLHISHRLWSIMYRYCIHRVDVWFPDIIQVGFKTSTSVCSMQNCHKSHPLQYQHPCIRAKDAVSGVQVGTVIAHCLESCPFLPIAIPENMVHGRALCQSGRKFSCSPELYVLQSSARCLTY